MCGGVRGVAGWENVERWEGVSMICSGEFRSSPRCGRSLSIGHGKATSVRFGAFPSVCRSLTSSREMQGFACRVVSSAFFFVNPPTPRPLWLDASLSPGFGFVGGGEEGREFFAGLDRWRRKGISLFLAVGGRLANGGREGKRIRGDCDGRSMK